MKSITERINESYNNYRYRNGQPKDTVLHFKGLVPAYLYTVEFDGQISDGKYENARPYNHWEWIVTSDIVIDGNEYYTASYPHSKNNYSFSDFGKYINDALNGDDKYDWSLRILNYGRMATVLESEGIDKIVDTENFSYVADIYGDTLYKNPDAEFEDTKDAVFSYRNKATSSKFYNKKYFDMFKKTTYKLADFKRDVVSMCKTINTYYNE